MKMLIDIPDEWKARIELNNRPNTIECGQLVESIWKGKILSKGKWIKKGTTYGSLCYPIRECSRCGYEYSMTVNFKYCPNCGDKKEENNESNDTLS